MIELRAVYYARHPVEAATSAATRVGVAATREARVGGQPNRSLIDTLAAGRRPREVATNLGVSVATLYRWVPALDRM